MESTTYYVFTLTTLILSLIIIAITVTRFHCGECKRSRMKYTFILLAALASGLQPYFMIQLTGASSSLAMMSLLWLMMDGSLSMKEHRKIHQHRNEEEK